MKKNLIKKVGCILLACMLCNGMIAYGATVMGDLDGNGQVTLRDALIALKDVNDIEELPKEQVAMGDIDGDTAITEYDAYQIFRKASGMCVYYPGEKVTASGKIYIAGDSIAAQHDVQETDIISCVGWGVVLSDYFDGEKVTVINEARSGRSSGSYVKDTDYSKYIGDLAKGDYYLISFGHNDEKTDRYSSPYESTEKQGSFKWNLANYYIEPALEVGAYPVLISSVVRCEFSDGQLTKQSHTPYAVAMEELVREYKEKGFDVGYIDMHQITTDYYNEIGKDAAEALHAKNTSGLDRTHYNEVGANKAAEFILNSMKEQGYDISKYLLP